MSNTLRLSLSLSRSPSITSENNERDRAVEHTGKFAKPKSGPKGPRKPPGAAFRSHKPNSRARDPQAPVAKAVGFASDAELLAAIDKLDSEKLKQVEKIAAEFDWLDTEHGLLRKQHEVSSERLWNAIERLREFDAKHPDWRAPEALGINRHYLQKPVPAQTSAFANLYILKLWEAQGGPAQAADVDRSQSPTASERNYVDKDNRQKFDKENPTHHICDVIHLKGLSLYHRPADKPESPPAIQENVRRNAAAANPSSSGTDSTSESDDSDDSVVRKMITQKGNGSERSHGNAGQQAVNNGGPAQARPVISSPSASAMPSNSERRRQQFYKMVAEVRELAKNHRKPSSPSGTSINTLSAPETGNNLSVTASSDADVNSLYGNGSPPSITSTPSTVAHRLQQNNRNASLSRNTVSNPNASGNSPGGSAGTMVTRITNVTDEESDDTGTESASRPNADGTNTDDRSRADSASAPNRPTENDTEQSRQSPVSNQQVAMSNGGNDTPLSDVLDA